VAVGTIGTVSVSYVQDGANYRIKVHDGSADTLRINVVESQIPSGGVALSGQPGTPALDAPQFRVRGTDRGSARVPHRGTAACQGCTI
jgi:hypothetical protein